MRAQLDPESTLIDTIAPGSDTVEIRGQRKHVLSYLGGFLRNAPGPRSSRCPVANATGSCWPGCLPVRPICWCLTSRPMIWMSRPWNCSRNCCRTIPAP
jgi:ATP-binding cassette subfamily F protein uup